MSDEEPTIQELQALVRDVFAGAAETNGSREWNEVIPDEAIVFEPLRAFLERDLPPAVSLVGEARGGTNLLPQFGWVMPWGREGSGKTSVLVDLLFYCCAGLDWLDYAVLRPLRIVVVVNEGIPGGLQDKLRQKVEVWDGDVDLVLDNLSVYASPWGRFTFRNEQMVEHARAYCTEVGADYFALDPLHTLGTTGAGAPTETEEFKQRLQDFGVWDNIGAITAHHANKGGMVSGDWGRHPDTVIHLEKDGKNPATRCTIEKARPADPTELGVPFLLNWKVETLGYERQAIDLIPTLPISEVVEAIKAALTEHGPLSKGKLEQLSDAPERQVRKGLEAALRAHEVEIRKEGRAHVVYLAEQLAEQTDLDEQIGMDTGSELGTEDLPSLPSNDSGPEGRTISANPPPSLKGGEGCRAKDGAPDDDDENPFL
jgi:hypothetical protein